MAKRKNQKPKVWKAIKTKQRTLKKGKLTFFKITSESDLDFLLTGKMLKYRKKSAKQLFKSAKKNYDITKKKLANVGTKNKGTKQIKKLEKALVLAKMLKAQTKEFYNLAKADKKKFK